MDELKEIILKKLSTHALAGFATVTPEGKPWVRYVVAKADTGLNIWIATFKGSRKTAHIAQNPKVHLVLGVEEMSQADAWLQVEGTAEILDDPDTRQAVWYEMLEPIFSGPDDPNYVVCKVKPTRIEYYTMNKRQPEVWEG